MIHIILQCAIFSLPEFNNSIFFLNDYHEIKEQYILDLLYKDYRNIHTLYVYSGNCTLKLIFKLEKTMKMIKQGRS